MITLAMMSLIVYILAPGGHPSSIGDLACIRDLASVRTSDLDPQLVLDTQLLLVVLRYILCCLSSGIIS